MQADLCLSSGIVTPVKQRSSKAGKKCVFWGAQGLHTPPRRAEGLLLKDIRIFLLGEADPTMVNRLVWVRDTLEKAWGGDKLHRRFVHAVWAGKSAGTFSFSSLPRSCLPVPLPLPLPACR